MKMTKSMRAIALVLMMALVLTMMFIININTVTANALGDGTTVEEPPQEYNGEITPILSGSGQLYASIMGDVQGRTDWATLADAKNYYGLDLKYQLQGWNPAGYWVYKALMTGWSIIFGCISKD